MIESIIPGAVTCSGEDEEGNLFERTFDLSVSIDTDYLAEMVASYIYEYVFAEWPLMLLACLTMGEGNFNVPQDS